MGTRRRRRYLGVYLLRGYHVHDVGDFPVESRRFLYASYVKAVPVAVVFRIACVRKVFDTEFEQIAVTAMYTLQAFQFERLFEVVGK